MDNPLLQPSPGLMIWTLVTFFLAMMVLRKYAFGPIQAALEKRRQAIIESVEAAERTKAEAELLLAEYKEQLASARSEAEGILDRARKSGDEMIARVKAEGEEQRQRAIAETRDQVKLEMDKAIGQIREAVAELTVEATEKITRGAIDTASHQQLVEQAIEELDFGTLQQVGARS